MVVVVLEASLVVCKYLLLPIVKATSSSHEYRSFSFVILVAVLHVDVLHVDILHVAATR